MITTGFPAAAQRRTPGSTAGGTLPRPSASSTIPRAPVSRLASSSRESAPATIFTRSTGSAGAPGASGGLRRDSR